MRKYFGKTINEWNRLKEEMDNKIIRYLKEHPDYRYDISNNLGLTKTATYNRLKKLESDGIIVKKTIKTKGMKGKHLWSLK